MDPLAPGDPEFVARYRLLARLGEGGQGVVYLGQAPDGRRVAVKVLRHGDERLAKEIDAARRVEPFCVAQVLDASLGGVPYIVTEYVEGPSLQEAGRHQGAGLQRLAVATATALAAIHRAGVVHRDFKPGNVLLGPGGPRVIDFGIARATDSSLTVTSSIVGTPAYMAPEQLAGAPVGTPADVFAWAGVIVAAATGTPPFGNDTMPAVIKRVLNDEPYVGDLAPPLREIVLDCLAKDPADRPGMEEVLLRLLGGTPPTRPGRRNTTHPVRRGGARLPVLPIVGGATVTALAAAAVVWWWPPSTAQTITSPAITSPAITSSAITTQPGSSPEASSSPTSTPTRTRKKTSKPSQTPTAKPTTKPTAQPSATPEPTRTTSQPRTGGGVSVSLHMQGAKLSQGCWSSGTTVYAVLTPTGGSVDHSYRWIVNGVDKGRSPSLPLNSTLKHYGPQGLDSPSRNRIIFKLLTPQQVQRSVTFEICPPFTTQ
ncbi:protein kinase [Nonomuraea sp. NPDC050643]|uniref:serine/threonine-protein kinase n=1 Tax=Nonomuraea sp. NPDC050643 TaxID=3155660 RepID=UPI0033F5614B